MINRRRSCFLMTFLIPGCLFPLMHFEVRGALIGSDSPVRVVSEDATNVVLDFQLPPFEVAAESAGTRLVLSGWPRTKKGGAADLPFTGVLIESPAGVTATAYALNCEERLLPLERIALVPVMPDVRLPLDQGKQAAAPTVQIEQPVRIRGASFVRLLIHPFAWDEPAGAVRYWERARIRVDFRRRAHPARGAQSILVPGAALEEPYPPGPRIRIEVTQPGIYEISSRELERLGFLARVSPRQLQLWHQGRQVAFEVAASDRSSRRRYFLRFYATAADSPFTDTNVYWLCSSPEGRKATRSRNASPEPGAPAQNWFDENAVWHENNLLWDRTPGAPETDFWFWERLTAGAAPGEYEVMVGSPESDDALLKIWLRGRSIDSRSPNHHVRILWDGTPIGDALWDDTNEYCAELPLTGAQVKEGKHTLTLYLPGDTGATIDQLYFDRMEIQYKRRLAAGAGDLFFRIESPAARTMELQTKTGSDRETIDVTDPYNVVWLDGVSKQAGQTSQVLRFSHPGQTPASYYVFGREHIRKPSSISYWQPEGLRDSSNQADHLILAPQEFVSAVQILRSHRQSQGFKSRIVALEEIFNEFGHGFPTPEAIRAFLTCAYQSWSSPRLRYVLLVGDGTVDYKDYYKTGKKGKAPVHLTRTSLRGITPDDHWYACVDGDDPVADLMIGRIPGENPDQVAAIVSKIVQFEQSGGKANPLLTAAADNERVFEETSDKLMALAPPYFTVEKAYLRLLGNGTRPMLLDSLGRGPAVTSYTGHGDLIRWATESILQSADAPKIGNSPDSLSFFVALNCLNGYFGYPYYYCLAEELINAPAAALACLAPTGGTFPDEHEIFGLELFSAIFEDRLLTLGNAVAQAKVAAYAKGVFAETILEFTLFGDPATRLKDW